MPYNQSLAGRTRDLLAGRRDIDEKRMFGGIVFLLNGNMLVGIWKDSLIARLGAEEAEAALREPDVGPFDITGKPMKNWVLVGPAGVDTDEQLRSWIDRADRFVRTLPAK